MKLTAKQTAFVREYCVDYNASAAARRAGYSRKSAGAIGSENLTKPAMREAVQAHQADLKAALFLDEAEVITVLRDVAHDREPPPGSSARVRAAERLGKHIGMWSGDAALDLFADLMGVKERLEAHDADAS